MAKTIKVATLLSTDIRSRLNADAIRREMGKLADGDDINIDMTGVVFISRSFADELLNIKEKCLDRKVDITNASGNVRDMLNVVSKSRHSTRVYRTVESDVVVLNDMASLRAFFAAM